MTHFLEGKRIYLREVREKDLTPDYVAWLNDPDVNRYLETRFYPQTHEMIYDYWMEHGYKRDEPWFAICLKEKNVIKELVNTGTQFGVPSLSYEVMEKETITYKHIGNIKLGPIDSIHRNGEIALFIGNKGLWGRGYATEAINLIVDYAFKILNLHKVKAKVYFDNVGSLRAFRKVGFKEIGMLVDECFCNGAYTGLVLMERING